MSFGKDELERMDRESGLPAADWSRLAEPRITPNPLDYNAPWPEIINRGRAQPATSAASHPWRVTTATNEDDEKVFRIDPDSTLQDTIDPREATEIGIEDLGEDIAFSVIASASKYYFWLEVDLTPTFTEPPGNITARIGHGNSWGSGKAFWPKPIEFNTSDGTRDGGGGEPPDDLRQVRFFVPLAYVATTARAQARGVEVAEEKYLVQLARNHLALGKACYDGYQNDYAIVAPASTIPET